MCSFETIDSVKGIETNFTGHPMEKRYSTYKRRKEPIHMDTQWHCMVIYHAVMMVLHDLCSRSELGTDNGKPAWATGGTLQRKSHLCIPRQGIARPQSQFPPLGVFRYCVLAVYRQSKSNNNTKQPRTNNNRWQRHRTIYNPHSTTNTPTTNNCNRQILYHRKLKPTTTDNNRQMITKNVRTYRRPCLK